MNEIIASIKTIAGVEISEPLTIKGALITGNIIIAVGDVKLPFELVIYPQYPFQVHDTETIKFINKGLIEYNHVMSDGHVCIHTQHNPELKTKIISDFDSLKQWINKYYLKKEGDIHYEHLIVKQGDIDNTRFTFLFTEVDYRFKKGEFGYCECGFMVDGAHEKIRINTLLVQSFTTSTQVAKCKWSKFYDVLPKGVGIYLYIEDSPAKHKRFIIDNWLDLEPYVDASFMDFLYKFQTEIPKKDRSKPLFMFVGYEVPGNEVHWQCVAIDVIDVPNYGEKLPGTKTYVGRFYDMPMNWMATRNVSYKYFFGRGSLNKKLTDSKILIVGVGALGSQLATTLARGGCKSLTVTDYDIKEPENVCRSEYLFKTGLTGKVLELSKTLIEISPFVDVKPYEFFTDAIKDFINSGFHDTQIKESLEQFDFIFDCSTDNDLAFILDRLNPKSEIINISITNKAKELVCVTKPNLYNWMNELFAGIDSDVEDLYNPTGCWSPTFKASYNDIAIMVQQAIQQINQCFENDKPLRNFILEKRVGENININYKQF
ncbi:MAG: ThiF family adenylyltransferase [Bacteroidia bacterium]|nr:ThiF family adenylyltransferase [Bacteroidia bacterium]